MADQIQINQKKPGDFGYLGFYKGKEYAVYTSEGLGKAQEMVQAHVKAKKSWHVSIHLCERPDGSDVVHTAVD